jgi:flagellin
MGVQLNLSVKSTFARRQTDQASRNLLANQEQLSSLLRINRASDDAAGLAIAEGFATQVRQYNQEVSNFQSGSNLLETTNSALGSQSDAISRVRELATQASNGTLNDDQRAALNQEAQQLLEQIDQTAQTTRFNETSPLNDGPQQISLDGAGDITLDFEESTVASLGLENIDLSTQVGAQAALEGLDTAQDQINSNRASIGTQQNTVQATIDQRSSASINLQEAESAIRDLDVGRAVIEQTRNELLLQAGVSAIVQGNTQSQNASILLGG